MTAREPPRSGERPLAIEPATPDDVATIHELVVELAIYERAPDSVTGTTEMLGEALFGADPAAAAIVARRGGETIGFALYHDTFSTWTATRGMWLEDLYVREDRRRGGVGGALFAEVARIAVARGCARLEWVALDWNDPALAFYAGLSAERLDDWVVHRLDSDRLAAAAGPGSIATGTADPRT